MTRKNRWLCVVSISTVMGTLAASNFVGASTSPKNGGGVVAGDLPCVVKFETGAKSFLKGDVITITEVRGTADTIERGNIYCVKGTYKLASREKAMLAAYTTVSKASDDGGPSLRVQHAYVDRGEGTFTLYLPMYVDGCPHVSFYSETNSIGGVYFGTGKSLFVDGSEKRAKTDTTESLREELNRLESRIKALEGRAN